MRKGKGGGGDGGGGGAGMDKLRVFFLFLFENGIWRGKRLDGGEVECGEASC